jgi:hypothetical protein
MRRITGLAGSLQRLGYLVSKARKKGMGGNNGQQNRPVVRGVTQQDAGITAFDFTVILPKGTRRGLTFLGIG